MFKKILFLVLFFCILSSLSLADYRINAVDYPKEILVQRGWTLYLNITIMNAGDENLNNATISFEGEFPQWFEVQTNQTGILGADNNASFLVKLTVPSAADARTYSFVLSVKSKEASNADMFIVRVFDSKVDMMLYQIQKLEIEIEDVKRNATEVGKSGKNVSSVINVLNEANSSLESARSYASQGEDKKATDSMINAENLVKEASYDLSIAPPNILASSSSSSLDWVALPVVAIIITAVAVVFYFRTKKVKYPVSKKGEFEVSKKETVIEAPVEKIREIVLEGRDVQNLENEMKDVQNSLNLLEDEFKENLISQESYDELKAKYERRILELKGEIDRNKGV